MEIALGTKEDTYYIVVVCIVLYPQWIMKSKLFGSQFAKFGQFKALTLLTITYMLPSYQSHTYRSNKMGLHLNQTQSLVEVWCHFCSIKCLNLFFRRLLLCYVGGFSAFQDVCVCTLSFEFSFPSYPSCLIICQSDQYLTLPSQPRVKKTARAGWPVIFNIVVKK